MAKKSKKKVKEPEVTDVLIFEEEGWFVSYTGTDGRKKRMKLDAETRTDALFEVSHMLDVPEDSIQE